jgi:hypothetical protein
MIPSTELRCKEHGAVAGWRCTSCQHALCPDCVATKRVLPITLTACVRCGEFAEALQQRKGLRASLAHHIPMAFVFPLQGEGLALWLGMSGWLWLTSLFGAAGLALGCAGILGSLFGLTRSTARGHEHFQLSDGQDGLNSLFASVMAFLVATCPVWASVGLAQWAQQPRLAMVALGVGVVWSPTAFIGAATGARFVDVLNPMRVLGASLRLGKDLRVYVLSLTAVMTLWGACLAVGLALRSREPVVLSSLVASFLCTYAPLVGARISGWVLLVHGELFGWSDRVGVHELVLPGVEPRGVLPEPKGPTHRPLELELEAAATLEMPTLQQRFSALELSPAVPLTLDVSRLPSLSEKSAQEIRQAMLGKRDDEALDGFRATGLSAAEILSGEELTRLGQLAASRIDYPSAELAFRKASQRPGTPAQLGRVLVLLARLLAERMNNEAEAAVCMQRVVTDFPETDAAQYAARWLAQFKAQPQ